MEKTLRNTTYLTYLGVLIAIELIIGLVPNLGFIRLNPVMEITIMHIPVIVAAVMLGPKAGAILGFVFGFVSFINATFILPNPLSSQLYSPFYTAGAFKGNGWSLVICFVPRILVGLFAGLLYNFLKKTKIKEPFTLGIVGLIGSLTNTILVLGGIYLFFAEPYSKAYNMSKTALLTVIGSIISVNGMIEALIAAVLTIAICKALLIVQKRRKPI